MKRTFIAALALSAAAVAPVAAADFTSGLSVAQSAQVKAVLESDDNTQKMAAQIEAIVANGSSTIAASRFTAEGNLSVAQRAQIRNVNNSEGTTLQKKRQIARIIANG